MKSWSHAAFSVRDLATRAARPVLTLLGLILLGVAVPFLNPASVSASPTEIVKAVFVRSGGSWEVSVTLRHADTGWEHYANVWILADTDGNGLGRRELLHPHVSEQPFTRSVRVTLPAGMTKVLVRAGEKPNGINSNIVVVDLTKRNGERFEVR